MSEVRLPEGGLVIIGAGATGLEVIDIVRSCVGGTDRRIVAVDDGLQGQPAKLAQRDVTLIGDRSRLVGLDEEVVVTVGSPQVRRSMIDAARGAGLGTAAPIVHPRAVLSPGVQLGRGSVVYPNAVISTDVVVGAHSLVYMLVSLGHDVQVGENCVITPGVNLSGNVIVEDDVFIGSGAVVLPSVRIGRGATVGAGSVVTKDVAPGTVVFGSPAQSR